MQLLWFITQSGLTVLQYPNRVRNTGPGVPPTPHHPLKSSSPVLVPNKLATHSYAADVSVCLVPDLCSCDGDGTRWDSRCVPVFSCGRPGDKALAPSEYCCALFCAIPTTSFVRIFAFFLCSPSPVLIIYIRL